MDGTIFVRDATLAQVAQIDDFQRLELVARFDDVGTWLLDMDARSGGASDLLADGAGIVLVRDGTTVLSGSVAKRGREYAVDRNRLKVFGVDDNAWLARRAAHPQPSTATPPYNSQGYDVRTGTCSTILRQFVDVNAGPSALGARQVAGLTLAIDPALGPSVTGRARWQPLLTLLQELALAGGDLGFRVVQNGAGIQFQVYQPVDRTASVIFSTELGNLAAVDWSEEAPATNYVYVGGSGEDTARTIYEGLDSAAIARWGRVETFKDRRDTGASAELAQAAADALQQGAGPVSLSLTPIDLPQMAYGTHYGLGDRVTVAVDGTPVRNLIREIRISMTPDSATVVTPTLETPGRQDLLKVFDDLRKAQAHIRDLERR